MYSKHVRKKLSRSCTAQAAAAAQTPHLAARQSRPGQASNALGKPDDTWTLDKPDVNVALDKPDARTD
jgi:hypothetical protein